MVYRRSEWGSTEPPPPRDRAPSSLQSLPEVQPQNAFRNDGSFLEMFKRMQGANASRSSATPETSKEPKAQSSTVNIKNEDVKSVPPPQSSHSTVTHGNSAIGDEASRDSSKRPPLIGKRRGGRILPTGLVKKKRADEEERGGEKPKDPWSMYMAEVRRYKETSCEEDGKTRPLVK